MEWTINKLRWNLKRLNISWEKFKEEIKKDKTLLKCSNCQIEKDKSQFNIRKQSKTGHSSWCVPCNKKQCKERYISIKRSNFS